MLCSVLGQSCVRTDLTLAYTKRSLVVDTAGCANVSSASGTDRRPHPGHLAPSMTASVRSEPALSTMSDIRAAGFLALELPLACTKACLARVEAIRGGPALRDGISHTDPPARSRATYVLGLECQAAPSSRDPTSVRKVVAAEAYPLCVRPACPARSCQGWRAAADAALGDRRSSPLRLPTNRSGATEPPVLICCPLFSRHRSNCRTSISWWDGMPAMSLTT